MGSAVPSVGFLACHRMRTALEWLPRQFLALDPLNYWVPLFWWAEPEMLYVHPYIE